MPISSVGQNCGLVSRSVDVFNEFVHGWRDGDWAGSLGCSWWGLKHAG